MLSREDLNQLLLLFENIKKKGEKHFYIRKTKAFQLYILPRYNHEVSSINLQVFFFAAESFSYSCPSSTGYVIFCFVLYSFIVCSF